MTQPASAPPAPAYWYATDQPRPRRRVVPIVALVLAAVATIMAGVALARQQPPGTSSAPSIVATPSTASEAGSPEAAAALKDACTAWKAASKAMVTVRQPFIEKTEGAWSWDDPGVIGALAQAQAGVLTQIEYLRQHVAAATPAEVRNPIRDYIAATIDVIALDGQRQPAEMANDAADRGVAAAAAANAACER